MSLRDTPILKRIAITLTLGFAFILMASVFSPERSRAGSATQQGLRSRAHNRLQQGNAPESLAQLSTDAHAGLKSMGFIESGAYSIAIFATDIGLRYTIIRTETSEELGTLLSPEQLQQLLPDLDLQTLDFSAPLEQQPLMLAEPRE